MNKDMKETSIRNMNWRDMIREHFPEEADDLLKNIPDEDPDFSKMSIDEVKLYIQG